MSCSQAIRCTLLAGLGLFSGAPLDCLQSPKESVRKSSDSGVGGLRWGFGLLSCKCQEEGLPTLPVSSCRGHLFCSLPLNSRAVLSEHTVRKLVLASARYRPCGEDDSETASSPPQSPLRIQKMDPPYGSIIYTTGVLFESSPGLGFHWILSGLWVLRFSLSKARSCIESQSPGRIQYGALRWTMVWILPGLFVTALVRKVAKELVASRNPTIEAKPFTPP